MPEYQIGQEISIIAVVLVLELCFALQHTSRPVDTAKYSDYMKIPLLMAAAHRVFQIQFSWVTLLNVTTATAVTLQSH
jgi:hypothetical protein